MTRKFVATASIVSVQLFSAIFAVNPSVALAASFVIHGEPRSCSNIIALDRAAAAGDDRYFEGWTHQDFDTALLWSHACKHSGFQYPGSSRDIAIMGARAHRDMLINNVQAQANATARAAQTKADDEARAERERENVQAQHADRARIVKADSDCRATPQAQLYLQQELVIDEVETIAYYRGVIAREKKIGETSGYVNMAVLHEAGEQIVNKNEDLKTDFAAYKELGGKASTAQTVKHTLTSVCPD